MLKNNIIIFVFLFISLLLTTSCKKGDPVIPNEEELITTLIYSLTPVSGGLPVSMSFMDPDGDGGNSPVIIGGTLDPNALYDGSIQLFNETQSPAVVITTEVEAEKEEHQFFFDVGDSLDLSVQYADMDANGKPLGLLTRLTTGNVSGGTLRIILRHEPQKDAAGVDQGQIANAGGDTDVEVSFPVLIQ